MSRWRRLLAALTVLTGCGMPAVTTIPVMVRTTGAEEALLRVRLVRGEHPPALAECPTPCLVTLPEGTTYELELTGTGHYPATLTLPFDAVWAWKRAGATLTVPLLPRSAAR